MEVLLATLMVIMRPSQQYLFSIPITPELMRKLASRLLVFTNDKIDSYATGKPVDDKLTVTYFKNTSVTIDISDLTLESADQLILMDLPVDDHLGALMGLRNKFYEDRELITNIHLVSLASYAYLQSGHTLDSTLFLYDPDVVSKVVDLLKLSDSICSSAVIVLDAFLRHKSKVSEVISAINININHGTLLSLLRSVPTRHYDVADSLMQIISTISGSTSHTNILVGAGILSVFLELLGSEDRRLIPRVCGLIDIFVYTNNQGSSMFSNAGGVTTVVSRVKEEVEKVDIPTFPLLSEDSARQWAMAPLKALLRCIHRLMQSSGGTEGLRNLVDGDLPKAVKYIFERHEHFGSRVFGLAINVMTTFINNEPTSLSILQEMQLPQTLYAQLDSSIPATIEHTIGNAISAICLNSAGLEMTTQRPDIIRNLLGCALTSEDTDAMTTGTSLEELARHQQALRPIIEQAVIDKVQQVIDKADTFEPTEEEAPNYKLELLRQDGTVVTDTTNWALKDFNRLFRLLEGFVKGPTSCQNLIEKGILETLLRVPGSACVPVRFGATSAAQGLSHVFRVIGQHDHVKLAKAFIKVIEDDLRSIDLDREKWAAFHEGKMDPDFAKMRVFTAHLTYFAEFLSTLQFTHLRIASSLLKLLKPEFLQTLGEVLRMVIVQCAALKTPSEATSFDVDNKAENGKESGALFLATRTYALLTKFMRGKLPMMNRGSGDAIRVGSADHQLLFDYPS